MSAAKFNLFSRASLASLAAAAAGGLGIGLDAPKPDELDPDVPPVPGEGEGEDEDKNGKPADKPEGEDVDASAFAGQEIVLKDDAVAVAAEQFTAGRAAERARTAAVLGSDEGKANPAMAGWLLGATPDAKAEDIVAQLKTMPAGASTPAPAPAAGIPDTDVDLGRPAAKDALNDRGAADGQGDVWDDVQGTKNGASAVVPADAGRMALAAISAGATLVTTGAAASPAPAVVPTGN